MMRPLPFVWPYWLPFGAVFAWAFSPEYQIVRRARKAATRSDSPDAPAFSGILMNTGLGVALGSWASTTLLVLASFVVYRYRIAVEERALLAAVGEPYREFMRTRRRLIPYIY